MRLSDLSLLQLSLLWTFALVLSPLLVLQGWYVRRTAQRLPEGAPPASGQTQPDEDPQLSILGIGDSVIAGVGVGAMQDSVTARAAFSLARAWGVNVRWEASGVNGEDSARLLQRLRQDGVPPADIYLVSIGVNDVTGLTGLVRWQIHVTELVAMLRDRKPRQVVLLGVPPMQRFHALPRPLNWAMGVRAAMLNHTLRQVAGLLDNVSWLDLGFELDAQHLAEDGYHPNELACREMGQQLAQTLQSASGTSHDAVA